MWVRILKYLCTFLQAINLQQRGKGTVLNFSCISWLFGQNSVNHAVGELVPGKFFNGSFDRKGPSSGPHDK